MNACSYARGGTATPGRCDQQLAVPGDRDDVTDGAGDEDLDVVGAVSEVLADGSAQPLGPAGDAESCSVAVGGAEGAARGEHALAGNVPPGHGLPELEVDTRHLSDHADGRDPGAHDLSHDLDAPEGLTHRRRPELAVLITLPGPDRHVGVRVDEAGEERRVTRVEDIFGGAAQLPLRSDGEETDAIYQQRVARTSVFISSSRGRPERYGRPFSNTLVRAVRGTVGRQRRHG